MCCYSLVMQSAKRACHGKLRPATHPFIFYFLLKTDSQSERVGIIIRVRPVTPIEHDSTSLPAVTMFCPAVMASLPVSPRVSTSGWCSWLAHLAIGLYHIMKAAYWCTRTMRVSVFCTHGVMRGSDRNIRKCR